MSDSLASSGAPAQPAASHPRRRTRPAAWMVRLPPLLLVVLWQVAASTGALASSILPSPRDIAHAAYCLTPSGEPPANLETSPLRALARVVGGGLQGLRLDAPSGLDQIELPRASDTVDAVRLFGENA